MRETFLAVREIMFSKEQIIVCENSEIARDFSLLTVIFRSPLLWCIFNYQTTRTDGILQCLHVGSGEFKGPLHRQRVESSHSLALYLQVQPGVEDKRSESNTLAAFVSVREQGQRKTVGPQESELLTKQSLFATFLHNHCLEGGRGGAATA